MAVDINRFVQLRPFLYHVTAQENLAALCQQRVMSPAAELMRRAQRPDLVRWRRPDSVVLDLQGQKVVIKDQRPLVEANLALEGSWELGDFVEYLNHLVFFWPGRADGPISNGKRLLSRYEADAPAVIRIATAELLSANAGLEPLFCPFNSGAARQNAGVRARRGPNLFTSAERFPRRESEVVELAFRSEVTLPESVEVRSKVGWRRLLLRDTE